MPKTQDENLTSFVLADSSIAAKLGSRMYFNKVPQGAAFPYAHFTRTGSAREGCLDDAAGSAPSTENFSLDIYSNQREEAEELRKLFEARLNCYRGTFGDTTAFAIFAEQQSSRHDPRGSGADEGIHAASLAVEVTV